MAMKSSLVKTVGILLLVLFTGALATPASAKSKHGRKHANHGAAHHAPKRHKPARHA
jgi:hypothetical protein